MISMPRPSLDFQPSWLKSARGDVIAGPGHPISRTTARYRTVGCPGLALGAKKPTGSRGRPHQRNRRLYFSFGGSRARSGKPGN